MRRCVLYRQERERDLERERERELAQERERERAVEKERERQRHLTIKRECAPEGSPPRSHKKTRAPDAEEEGTPDLVPHTRLSISSKGQWSLWAMFSEIIQWRVPSANFNIIVNA